MGTTNTAERTQQYVNTMVFCIIAGIISVMLLVLITTASERVRAYSPFIITIEVGLVLIIVAAVVRLIMYERTQLKSSKLGAQNRLSVNTCPDYWTRTGNTCVNGFNSLANPSVTYQITGTADANKSEMRTTLSLDDYNNKTIQDACTHVAAHVQAPWTDVRAVCDSYRISS